MSESRQWAACAALLAAVASLGAGCRHTPFWPRAVAECPGVLRPTGEIAGDRRLDLRVRVRAQDVDTAMRLALEKRGDTLTLVGLSPLGAVLFSVVQKGTALQVEALPASVLEVPPENVLRDVHRVLFLGVASLGAETGPADGERSARRGDTRITETWQGGVLRRRIFADASTPSGADAVVIDFDPAPAEGLAAAEIHNGRCGYEATLVTLTDAALR